jgi:phosphoserine aminotransferase
MARRRGWLRIEARVLRTWRGSLPHGDETGVQLFRRAGGAAGGGAGEARDELLDFRGTGMSVMEMSHRSKAFIALPSRPKPTSASCWRCRTTTGAVPAGRCHHAVRHGADEPAGRECHGGLRQHRRLVEQGHQGGKALLRGERGGQRRGGNFSHVPDPASWSLSEDAAYLHICSNETIGGVQFHDFPEVSVPLVATCRRTSCRGHLDVSRFGLIYAGAQKNIGPRASRWWWCVSDLLGRARPGTPSMLDYAVHAEADSMSTRRPPMPGTWPGWCSSGSRARAGWPASRP